MILVPTYWFLHGMESEEELSFLWDDVQVEVGVEMNCVQSGKNAKQIIGISKNRVRGRL